MDIIKTESRMRAVELAQTEIKALDIEIARIEAVLNEVTAKRATVAAYLSIQEATLRTSDDEPDELLDDLRNEMGR